MRYTSLTSTISHDNNHRTSKHASTSWRSDGSPSCLGGSSHGWVPVKTHGTPVPTWWGGCGLLTNSTTHINESKKNEHDNNIQGHSGRSLIDLSLQDNVLIPDDFFEYIHHVGCAINLHSIINSGLIPGGQNLSKRQIVFFLHVDPTDKEHKDPETIDLEAPRLAQYISSFTIHSQPIVSRRLSRWKLEKSKTKKYISHLGRIRRFP